MTCSIAINTVSTGKTPTVQGSSKLGGGFRAYHREYSLNGIALRLTNGNAFESDIGIVCLPETKLRNHGPQVRFANGYLNISPIFNLNTFRSALEIPPAVFPTVLVR